MKTITIQLAEHDYRELNFLIKAIHGPKANIDNWVLNVLKNAKDELEKKHDKQIGEDLELIKDGLPQRVVLTR